jgi:hypothetical protein
MTTYSGGIDLSESPGSQGVRYSMLVGSGGVTYGQPVKMSSTARTVVASTTTSDVVVGLAATTQSEGDTVTVLGPGCLAKTPYTLTQGGKVGLGTSGTAGTLVDYSSGTCVGWVETGATTASEVRINIQF